MSRETLKELRLHHRHITTVYRRRFVPCRRHGYCNWSAAACVPCRISSSLSFCRRLCAAPPSIIVFGLPPPPRRAAEHCRYRSAAATTCRAAVSTIIYGLPPPSRAAPPSELFIPVGDRRRVIGPPLLLCSAADHYCPGLPSLSCAAPPNLFLSSVCRCHSYRVAVSSIVIGLLPYRRCCFGVTSLRAHYSLFRCGRRSHRSICLINPDAWPRSSTGIFERQPFACMKK